MSYKNVLSVLPDIDALDNIQTQVANLVYDLGGMGVIAGSAAAYCTNVLNVPKPHDIDVFTNRFDDVVERFKRITFGDCVQSAPNVVTFYGFDLPIQVIGTPLGTLTDVRPLLDTFDFTVCQAAVVEDSRCLVSGDFLAHADDRLLIFTDYGIENIYSPVKTLRRIERYVSRGYKMPRYDMLKFMKAVTRFSEDDLDNIERTYYERLFG